MISTLPLFAITFQTIARDRNTLEFQMNHQKLSDFTTVLCLYRIRCGLSLRFDRKRYMLETIRL
jgi:hypothetical protein